MTIRRKRISRVSVSADDRKLMSNKALGFNEAEAENAAIARASARALFAETGCSYKPLAALVHGLPRDQVVRFFQQYLKSALPYPPPTRTDRLRTLVTLY